MLEVNNFNAVRITLASPDQIRSWSRGEVTKPGSTIIVADGRGYAIGDGPVKLIASMTSTMMVVRDREGFKG